MALTKVAPAGIGSTPGDGYRIGSSFLHSTGVELTNANASGIVTAAQFDGKLNIGIATFTDDVKFTGASGNILFDKSANRLEFDDSVAASFGTGANLRIYGTSSNGQINNYTGDLLIQNDSSSTTEAIKIRGKGGEESIVATADGSVASYYNNVKRLETSGIGVTVTGQLDVGNVNSTGVITATKFVGDIAVGSSISYGDNEKAYFGTDLDLTLYHSGSSGYISNTSSSLHIRAKTNQNGVNIWPDGAVQLHHSGTEVLETQSWGFWSHGTIKPSADTYDLGGNHVSNRWNDIFVADGGELNIGDGGDLKIYHAAGAESHINNTGLLNIDGTTGVRLEYNNLTRVHCTSSGVSLVGDVDVADKIIHTGDTNTMIRFPAADAFSVETAGSERIRVDNAGRLLIGQTGSINGGILCVGTGQGNNPVGGEGVKLAPSANTITFLDSSSNGSDTGNIQFWNTVYNNCSAKIEFFHAAGNVGGIKFHTTPASGTLAEILQISHNGTVGIHATNPDANFKLDLNGHMRIGSGNTGRHIMWSRSGLTAELVIGVDGYGNAVSNEATIQSGTSRPLVFMTNGGERLRIESGGNVKLPDNGMLRFGAGPDLSLYHDHANQVNIITANTNLPIKIQGDAHFYHYTASGGYHAKIDGSGISLQNATRPTLPTTGVQPMVFGYATHFYKEIHRTISDYRGLCDGSHSGYLLLVQAYGGSGTTAGKKFYGTIMADRGGTGSGNSTNVAHIHATTAYNTDRFNVSKERNTQYFTHAAKVTYSGTDYLALKFGATGGGPDHGIHIDGTYRNVDANFCKIVRTNEVTVVDDNYGSMNNMPAADALLCGFSQRHMSGSGFDNGVLKGGVTVFEHGDCFDPNSGVFTAKFNGVYQFGCGVLVQTGSGRLEGAIKIDDGGGYDTLVNFNGTGTTYDGPSAIGMTIMRAGWTARVERLSGNAYDPTHGNNYFWGWMVQAMNKANVPATFP